MPHLIRTPDEIFRQEPGKDLYFVKFFDINDGNGKASPDEGYNPLGRQELIAWMGQTLPNVKIEPLAPPEDSGFIEGGVHRRIRIEFDAQSLKIFCERWEEPCGKSKDPRWQCMQMSYQAWLDSHYPLSADLLRARQSIVMANGESLNLFSFTPVSKEQTGLPCTIGLYWNRDDQPLRPGIVLYRNNAIEHHAWLSLDGTEMHLVEGCDLVPEEIIRCRQFLTPRHGWLTEWFDWLSDIHDFPLSQTQTIDFFMTGYKHGHD